MSFAGKLGFRVLPSPPPLDRQIIAGFAGLAALVVAAYFQTAKGQPGVTTEIAAFATYWIGTMAGAGAMGRSYKLNP